jgi:hypothetical protein
MRIHFGERSLLPSPPSPLPSFPPHPPGERPCKILSGTMTPPVWHEGTKRSGRESTAQLGYTNSAMLHHTTH